MGKDHITRQVVDELYVEALVLSDEARDAFNLRMQEEDGPLDEDMKLTLSIEGLRTTTRLMNVLAWLLNQRAYLSGELSENQLRRYGELGEERPSDPVQAARLSPNTRLLVRDSERLYARIARLDRGWRMRPTVTASPVEAMQGRLATAFGSA
ncbi:MAG: DUF1465 family protein [Sphingomonadaceae bacterium]